MRPALQRLLARPSSLDLLRALVGPPTSETAPRRRWRSQITPATCYRCQSHAVALLPADDDSADFNPITSNGDHLVGRNEVSTKDTHLDKSGRRGDTAFLAPHSLLPPSKTSKNNDPNSNTSPTIRSDMLDFESDLLGPHQGSRLVDQPGLNFDMNLWFQLLDFRHRRYGDEGVLMIWKAMQRRRLKLPVDGTLAAPFWETFIDLGLRDDQVLQQICKYANRLYDTDGYRWPMLYAYIMKHFLLQGRGSEVIPWHDRLIERHPSSLGQFTALVREVVKGGDSTALKEIYHRNNFRKLYIYIVPPLAEQQDFQAALDWHFYLLSEGDRPHHAKVVQPLIQYFATYRPAVARRLTKSLVSSGAAFGSRTARDVVDMTDVSRELMDNIFINKFGFGSRRTGGYNDSLGARWFATRWVSLDVAINMIHALGVEEIGPLSLHSIALRDPECEKVAKRISQLRELGISVGDSLFSKSVESFAKDGEQDFLTGLLESDQHPSVLEDQRLQEDLIADFARQGQWESYHRSVAIQLLRSSRPEEDELNLVLRKYAAFGDRTGIIQTLEEMRSKGFLVRARTIHHIIKQVLRPRSRAQTPSKSVIGFENFPNDIDLAVFILRGIMTHNGFVPVTTWVEILRRLGMLGRLDELENLCVWLAEMYNSRSPHRWRSRRFASPLGPDKALHLPPVLVPTSHKFHPLHILFSDALQEGLVHWGFIHGIKSPGASSALASSNSNVDVLKQFTIGIRLLRELEKRGVSLNHHRIRRAIYHRLLIMYGPGESKKRYNQRLKASTSLSLQETVGLIDEAWGRKVFDDVEQLEITILSSNNRHEQSGSGQYQGDAWVKEVEPGLEEP